MGLFLDICEIFLENTEKKISHIRVQSLLWKYKEELDEVFFDDIYIATSYEDIKYELEQYKFSSNRQYVSKFVDLYVEIKNFVDRIEQSCRSCVEVRQEDIMISIAPMHWTRYFSRGFNHMAYIAKNFAKKEKIVYKNLLTTRFTFHQARLSRTERLKNRKNIFSVKNVKKMPKTVILLDDIVTTGVTVNECARVLKKAWVKKVIIFALATNI